MKLPFRSHHIITFLTRRLRAPNKPLDLALSEYFRQHKSIGSHDRRSIGETIYGMVRWQGLLDYLCAEAVSIEARLKFFEAINWTKVLSNPSIPKHLRLGTTSFLFHRLEKAYGPSLSEKLCQTALSQAPISIRANRIKISREELFKKLEQKSFTGMKLSSQAPDGIVFSKREALFSLPEFKEGLFEMQDEGSQLVASLIQAEKGQHILDYCSGSGGKSLAFASSMQGKGQIYLHDIRPSSLLQAKQRFKRAGIQNVQFLAPGHPKLSELKGKMDWVLADVPCSGTGTLRRHPEMSWKIDEPLVSRLVQEQRQIFSEALSYLREGGRIVYATCSILPEENEEQMAFFLSQHQLTLEKEPLSILPSEGGMDGFFAAVFSQKKCSVM